MLDKIGIFGGTFDPIHNGHLILAQIILEKVGLDEMWFVPANFHIFKEKNEISSGIHRQKMIELAIEGNVKFKCLDSEIKRNSISYTYDTLFELKQSFPEKEFYFLLGADNLNTFYKWKNANEIMDLCQFVVFGRPQSEVNEAGKVYLKNAKWVDTPLFDISSTEIKKRFIKGKTCQHWIPDSVNTYILNNKLYG